MLILQEFYFFLFSIVVFFFLGKDSFKVVSDDHMQCVGLNLTVPFPSDV